ASVVAVSVGLATAQTPQITLSTQESGTDSLLIGVSPVDASVVWLSGAGGTVLRTTNGGETWDLILVPGADSLQFRDVHGVDASTAYVLSAGVGPASRIYKTEDGGESWTLQFTNPGPGGFFDCMDFWDADHGIAFSDSYEGSFIVIRTDDGGAHWTPILPDALPPASDGEGGFASSGTCLQVVGDSTVFIGTGAGASPRLLRSHDRGISWETFGTPMVGGTSTSGISSLSFLSETDGYAFGLELTGNDGPIQNAIHTKNGGRTWTVLNSPQLPDIYGGVQIPGHNGSILITVGPKGIDYTADAAHWTSLTKLDHWGIAFADNTTGWAVGPGGRVTKLTVAP
ncbi:MAG: hypothetical protein WBW88_12970, partial [Rhodothermales bacterium]